MTVRSADIAGLLCDRSLAGLGPDDAAALEAALADAGLGPDLGLELAAAEIELALTEAEAAPMPEALAARIVTDFEAPAPAPEAARAAVVLPFEAPAAAQAAASAPAWRGPLAAAAAVLLGVALGMGLGRGGETPSRPEAPKVAKQTPPSKGAPRTPAEKRADLLVQADDLVRIEWTATEDAAAKGSSGDLVWSPSRQQGFMRFRGLAVNDPRQTRYQLWIFDERRDAKYPVDGGVFDVAASEVVVPIQAKLPVSTASLFAVTVEPPKGVVVSSRERIVLTAQPTAPEPTPP